MAWLAGGGIGVLALAVVVMAWRMVGMAAERATAKGEAAGAREGEKAAELALEAERLSHAADVETSKQLAAELISTRERYEARLSELRSNIATLEGDLDACTLPGTRAARLERLLSIAAPGGTGANPTP